MGKLTTHVLDSAHGRPGAGIRIELFRLEGDTRMPLSTALTNSNGRCDAPLIEGDAFAKGEYVLVFHVGDYFARAGVSLPKPRFIDRVVLRFGVADPSADYHVPLIVSPWAYSIYRGS